MAECCKMCRILPFLAALFLMCQLSTAVFTPEQTTRIETFVQEVMTCRKVPGLSLAVVKGDESWTRGFGYANISAETNVTTDTLFAIGSVTKAITTTLLAMMLNDSNGKWNWTSKVSDILGPDFAFVNDYRTKTLTLRDLLAHRTGLQRADLLLFAGYDHTVTATEFAKRFRFLPEVKSTRDQWEYNNWVYALAGHIVEVLSGESWEETLKKRIFQPLGMGSRVLGKDATTQSEDVAQPYFTYDGEDLKLLDSSIFNIHPGKSAGAIIASADDMAKWLHFILREGKTADNQPLVDSKIFKETFAVHESLGSSKHNTMSLYRPTYPASDAQVGYGYGWFIGLYKGYREIWHSGDLYAYISRLFFYPDRNFGIFVSTNGPGTKDASNAEKTIIYFIADLLLGDKPWLNAFTACSFPEPWKDSPKKKSSNSDVINTAVDCLDCYTGKYGHQFFGELEVKVVEGSSSLELQYRRIFGTLNSTDDKHKFQLDIGEPFRFYSRPENRTVLIPVTFQNMVNGRYDEIVIIFKNKMIFKRDVRFNDEILNVPTNTQMICSSKSQNRHDLTLWFLLFLHFNTFF